MLRILLACTLLLLGAATPAPAVLTPEGFGRVRIGMMVTDVERTLGVKLDLSDQANDPAVCVETDIPGRVSLYAMFERHRLTVISTTDNAVRTGDGVHVGTTEAELRKIFGARAVFKPRPYEEDVADAHEVVVQVKGAREFVFETEKGAVQEIRVGNKPGTEYMEGCA